MEPLLSGADFANAFDSVKETRMLYAKPLVIKRYVSETGGTFNGTAPTITYKDIKTQGRVYQITQRDVFESNGFYALGDIKTDTMVETVGYENKATNLKTGDRLVFEGNTYVVRGKPYKIKAAGGRLFTQTLWGRI